MKLLHCPLCRDLVLIKTRGERFCLCGKSWGRLTDEPGVVAVSLDGIVIGIPDREFQRALANRPETGRGVLFPTFLMPHSCKSVIVTQ